MTRRTTILEDQTDIAVDPVFRGAQALLLARFVLVFAVFDPLSFDTFELPKSVVAHVLDVVLVGLLCWLVVRYGRRALVWSPLHVAVGAVLVAFALATPLALDQRVALFGANRRFLGLTQMADDAVLYLATALLIRSTRDLLRLAVAAAVMVCAVLGYGLIQRLGLDPVRYNQGSTAQQPISTLGNSDTFGGFVSIAAIAPFGAALLLYARSRRILFAVLVAFGVAAAAFLITTNIRNGVLGIAAGLAATALLGWSMPGVRRRVLVTVGAAAIVVILAVVLSPLGARLTPSALAADGAIQSRLEIWQAAETLVRDRPLLGVGPDNFAAGYPSVRNESTAKIYGQPDVMQTSTHSWVWYALTSSGLIGTFALICALALSIAAAIRLAAAGHPASLALIPLAAYLGQGLVDIQDIALDSVLWVSMGVLAGASGVAVTERLSKRRPRPAAAWRRSWIVGVPVAALLVLAIGVSAPRFAASRSLNLSESYISAGDQKGALPYATDATRSDTRRPEYWLSLGTALAGVNPTAAASAYIAAAELAPWHPLYWQNLALVYRAAGNRAGAMAAARRAVAADPANAVARGILATVLLDAGDYAGAAREGETAAGIFPDDRTLEAPILAYIKLERWSDAIRLAQAGLAVADSVHLHLRLAQAYAGAGRIADAKVELAIVLAADPKNAEALDLRDFLATK